MGCGSGQYGRIAMADTELAYTISIPMAILPYRSVPHPINT